MPTTPPNSPSYWETKHNITDIQKNRTKWNKEWEKLLSSLEKSPGEVYKAMALSWKDNHGPAVYLTEARFRSVQAGFVCVQERLSVGLSEITEEKGGLAMIWAFLNDADRKNHMMIGLERACEVAFWKQDARAMCPEISVRRLAKNVGRPFIDLVEWFLGAQKVIKDQKKPLYLPSPWWDRSIEGLPKPLSKQDRLVYNFLTLTRNEFICSFLTKSLQSIAQDIVLGGSSGMNKVINVMRETPFSVASSSAKALSSMGDRPPIRCQSCSRKSETEFGAKTNFMICSTCKAKLDFSVHYCSHACQKKDWPTHKSNCGRRKVVKMDNSDWTDEGRFIRDVLLESGGEFSITSIGPGEPHYDRSPALQRQVSMITIDREAEYILFNSSGHPIRFWIEDNSDYATWNRINFRIVRRMAMSSPGQDGLAPMAEYLIKHGKKLPGMSRELIMKQLVVEYGSETEARIAEVERRSERNGQGLTVIESMSKLSTQVDAPLDKPKNR